MEYARNFMEYLNQKRNIPFEVHAFSSAEMFLEFAKNNETEILKISIENPGNALFIGVSGVFLCSVVRFW